MKVCPSCKVQNSDDSQFCSRCGANLLEENQEKQESANYLISHTLVKKLGLLAITLLLVGVVAFFYVNQRLGKSIPPYQQEKSTGAESSREKTLTAPEISSEGYARLIKEVQPAIVTIQTYDKSGEERSLGSGFFVNDQGHLITNYHVIKDSYYAIIKYSDGRETKVYTNKAIGIDRKADLVKIQVKLQKPSSNYLKIAESPPEAGERIVVVGSPLGLEQTVSDGVVSGIRQVDDLRLIQISAPISPGSSGGPVVNLKGEVVGVATFQFKTGQNINFAIPASKILALGEKEEEIELAKREGQVPLPQLSKIQKQPMPGFDAEWIYVANQPYFKFYQAYYNNKTLSIDNQNYIIKVLVRRKYSEEGKKEFYDVLKKYNKTDSINYLSVDYSLLQYLINYNNMEYIVRTITYYSSAGYPLFEQTFPEKWDEIKPDTVIDGIASKIIKDHSLSIN